MIRRIVLLALTAWLASAAWAQDERAMSRDEIRLAQKKLYELNHFPGPMDGVLSEGTRAAIARWQGQIKAPSTGSLTAEQYARLTSIDTSADIWGSMAGSTDGAYTAVWNKHSREESEAQMLPECRRKSREPQNCRVTSMSSVAADQEGWLAFIYCTRRERNGERLWMTVDGGRTRDGTIEGAYEYLDSKGFGRGNCKLGAVIEVRGRHK